MPERRTTAGERKHQVTIQALPGMSAEADAEIEAHVPAAISAWPISAQPRESLAAGGVQNATMYTVNISYRTDVSVSQQLVEECCTERQFQIVAIVPTDRRDALDLTCVTNG
jgi:head-tail adaptor